MHARCIRAAVAQRPKGSPNVLLEAMAAKLPVVATSVGGVPEMVENNESALLVSAHDPRTMAAAIARILDRQGAGAKLTTNAAEWLPHDMRRSTTREIWLRFIAR